MAKKYLVVYRQSPTTEWQGLEDEGTPLENALTLHQTYAVMYGQNNVMVVLPVVVICKAVSEVPDWMKKQIGEWTAPEGEPKRESRSEPA